MSPNDLSDLIASIADRRDSLAGQLEAVRHASPDSPSDDIDADVVLEALFLRAFTQYEADLERLFLHYVTGCPSASGQSATSYLAVTDESLARRIIVNGYKFLSWSKPDAVKDTASNYLDQGWPVIDMLATNTQHISDCEKIRNRIAHRSIEANSQFAAVQRNLFQTERLFEMTPGHLLRARFRGRGKLVVQHFNEILSDTLLAIADPPP